MLASDAKEVYSDQCLLVLFKVQNAVKLKYQKYASTDSKNIKQPKKKQGKPAKHSSKYCRILMSFYSWVLSGLNYTLEGGKNSECYISYKYITLYLYSSRQNL